MTDQNITSKNREKHLKEQPARKLSKKKKLVLVGFLKYVAI